MGMWMLVKDHLWRNRNWLAVASLVLTFSLSSVGIVVFEENSGHIDTSFQGQLYINFIIMTMILRALNHSSGAQIWRTLPFRESALANLVWGMAILTLPVVSLLIVLPLEFVFLCFGKVYSGSIAWPLLFLLIATLLSGLLAFVSASMSLGHARATSARNVRRKGFFPTSCTVRFLFSIACAGASILLILRPIPFRWSDLGPTHLAGMCLAAYLTWKSYRMRPWLLEPMFSRNALANEARGSDIAPLYHGSALAALAQEWKTTVRRTLLIALIFIGFSGLILLCESWIGLLPPAGKGYAVLIRSITIGVVMGGAMSVIMQVGRVSAVRAIRSLPLSGNQCVLLCLSYPCAMSIVTVPGIAAYLWLTGYGHFPTLLMAGFLLSTSLSAFGMFMLARFGIPGFITLMSAIGLLAGVYLSVATTASTAHPMPLSTPILCAGVLVLAVLGGVGYYGLRHLVENSSAVYKRKMLPQQFGQR